MNKFFLIAVFLFVGVYCRVEAQIPSPKSKLPVDSKVKIGKLENGFTYYIRENKKPEKRIEIRLVVNAGSILEDDNQRGLAHFVEHMCFNGTTHFAKNDLIKCLESMGIKFGPEINAYTSFDETVYMLSIPSDSVELVNKGLLVMEDWAHNVTFDSVEIDKERGVIVEEWRIGQGPRQRMLDKDLPIIFKNSRYADRLTIGKKEIIETAGYETIRNFYRDWYRPELMSLVVVGDMDIEQMEQKIKTHFSQLNSPSKPRKRLEYPVPDNKGTLVTIASDKEAPYTTIRVLFKDDTKSVTSELDYFSSIQYSFITGMLNRRMAELSEKSDPPFIGGGFYYGSLWARTKNALQGYAVVGENGIDRGLKTLLEETKRIVKYGFTQGELDRYKLDFMKRMEQAFNERDKTKSENFADEYVRNYLEKEPIPGIEFEYAFIKQYLDKVTLADINKLVNSLITLDNRVIVIDAPEKEGILLPDEKSVLAFAENVESGFIEAYTDKHTSASLMSSKPAAGKIVSEKQIQSIHATELKLSNGVTIILKPTDLKNDEVLMTAYAWGGSSVYSDSDHFTSIQVSEIIDESGVAGFSNSDLTKILSGKTVNVTPSLGLESEDVSGSCRPVDMGEMFQLVYLYFTSPRVDLESFQSFLKKSKDLYKNLAQEPMNYFYDKYNRIRCQNHPRGNYLPEESDWDKINYNRAIEIYKDRFSDASEFTFVFVGSFNSDTIKPLIEQYIASLPSTYRNESYKDLGIRPPSGKVVENIYKGTDPKSQAILSFTKEMKYNEVDAFLFSQLAQHLNRKYYEILREEMSGVYGVRTNANLAQVPYQRATLSITIPCSPDNVDSLVNAAINEILSVRENGVNETDINKLREIYKRDKEKRLEENGFWLGNIKDCMMFNKDFSIIPSLDRMNLITSDALKRVANEYIDMDNYLKVVLYPESMKK